MEEPLKFEKIEGYTIPQLVKLSKKSRNSVESWLSYNKVEPVISQVLYPVDTLERLKKAKVGRPSKKPETSEAPKKPRKSPVRKSKKS